MVGALAQAQAPDDPGAARDPYDRSDRNLPPGWGRPLLDRATEALLGDLTQRAPYEAQAAAMLSNVGRPNEAALGAGIGANLKTRLGMLSLPLQLREQAARTQLEGSEADRYSIENEVLRRNFGYQTSPFFAGGEFSRPPADAGQQDVTRPPTGGGEAPAGSPPVGAAEAGGPPPTAAPGPAAVPPQAEVAGGPRANPLQLPVTDESRARLAYLGMQYDRAAAWANRSPQARQDLGAILGEMTQTIANDPLAKNELDKRKTQDTSDIDLDKQLHLKATDLAKDSLAAAEDEFKAIAASPNAQLDPGIMNDPSRAQAWIDARAKQIFTGRYAALAQQIRATGRNPNRYLAEPPITESPLPPQQTADGSPPPTPVAGQRSAVPTLPDGTPLTDDTGAVFQPPTVGATSPAVKPAPVVLPGLPTLSPEKQQAVQQLAAQQPPPSPFVMRQLTPTERIDLNAKQEDVVNMVNTLASLTSLLQRADDINQKSYSGPLGDVYTRVAQVRAGLHQLFTGKESYEPALNNTTELAAIISRMTLQNLQTLVKSARMTNFELEYVQQLESAMDMTQGQRQRLFSMAQQIIKPRFEFEKLRASALAQGRYVDPNSYEDWFKQQYGKSSPFDLSGPKPVVKPPGG